MIGEGASAGRVLGLVPARAGSQGLPGKNVRSLAGRPMVAWTLEACREASVLDQVVVSTDDARVAEIAAEMGYPPPFRRRKGHDFVGGNIAIDDCPLLGETGRGRADR